MKTEVMVNAGYACGLVVQEKRNNEGVGETILQQ